MDVALVLGVWRLAVVNAPPWREHWFKTKAEKEVDDAEASLFDLGVPDEQGDLNHCLVSFALGNSFLPLVVLEKAACIADFQKTRAYYARARRLKSGF